MEDRYKWIALSNTTLAILLATLDASITLIAMPDIFRGIHLDPLVPANSFYLLWMILGYLVVSSVLIVSLGRLGDIYGRVKIFNLGYVIYTVASLLLAIDWMSGQSGAMYLVVFRIVQGVGGACLLANAAAIITDAFPANQRGMALGINNIVGVSGMFVGLILGGLLAPIDWRLVFLISVPVGLFGTVWGYLKLEERSKPRPAKIDWGGNVTFALGLVLAMVAVTYGIRPYGGSPTGWGSPRVLILAAGSIASLAAFAIIERRVAEPMFRLPLFRIRAFTFGTLSTFLAAIARGGLMFMLIIWLQGIWLPLHGYDYTEAPLWAGIYMLPLTIGLLCAGPLSGYLSDRYGARPFATGGMLAAAASFALLTLLPIVRPDSALQRDLDGDVRLAEPGRGDEQPAARRSWRRRRHEPDLPELGAGDLDRDLLHPADHRPRLDPALDAEPRPRSPRPIAGCRPQGGGNAADLRPLRRLPRLQPDPAPGRRASALAAAGPRPCGTDRPDLLPDLRAVRRRARHRLRLRDRRLPGRRRSLAVARRPLRAFRGGRAGATERCRYPQAGGATCALSGTDSPPSP
jgi:MFS family permease